MNDELFELSVLASTRIDPKDVIGTKKEYRLHGALKYYFQPDDRFHEVKVGRYLCDAVSEDGSEFIEIQTRALNRMANKIKALTKLGTLTVVYPIITKKRLIVTYEDDGEASVRKSPKSGSLLDFFHEIYPIRDLLLTENLRFKLVFLHCDEIRVYAGTKAERRPFQKPISIERIPTFLESITELSGAEGLAALIPDSLPEYFNSLTLAKAMSIPRAEAGYVINPLVSVGVLCRVGKNGREYVYTRASAEKTHST